MGKKCLQGCTCRKHEVCSPEVTAKNKKSEAQRKSYVDNPDRAKKIKLCSYWEATTVEVR